MGNGAREAAIRIGFDQRYLRASQGATERSLKRWGSKTGADLAKTFRGAFGGLGTIGGFLGVAGLAAAAKEVLDFQTRVTRLGIQARVSKQYMEQFKAQIFEVARARGIDPDQLLGGAERFVALTGDIDTATEAMDGFAKVAAASGANMQDIMVAAASLSKNLGITGKEMGDAFGQLVSMGKSGAVELKDMATILPGLTPQFALFAKHGVSALNELSAVMQVIRVGFSTSEEAATGMESLMTALVKQAGHLRAVGVNPFQKDGKTLRDFADIVFDLIRATKGNPEVLQKVLGRHEAFAALIPLMTKGRSELQKFMAMGAQGAAELDKNFAEFAQTPAHKIAQAKAQLKQVFDETLVKSLPLIAGAMQAIADAIGFAGAHSKELLALFLAMKGGGLMSSFAQIAGAAGAAGSIGRGAGGAARNFVIGPNGYSMGAGSRGPGALASFIGGLGTFTTAVGLAATAAYGIAAAFDVAMADIDRTEARHAAQEEGDDTARQAQDDLLGRGGKQVMNPITGEMISVGGKAKGSKDRQLRQALATRRLYGEAAIENGGAIAFDPSKLDDLIRSKHPDFTPADIEREKQRIYASASVLNANGNPKEGPGRIVDINAMNAGTPGLGPQNWVEKPGLVGNALTLIVQAGPEFKTFIENMPQNRVELGPVR